MMDEIDDSSTGPGPLVFAGSPGPGGAGDCTDFGTEEA